jgi:hypothetical protein
MVLFKFVQQVFLKLSGVVCGLTELELVTPTDDLSRLNTMRRCGAPRTPRFSGADRSP